MKERMGMAMSDRIVRRFLLAHVADGSRILDVGCGTGWAALLLARERPACVVHGADSDAASVRKLNAQFRRFRRRTALHCYPCAAENLGSYFVSASYDTAVGVHALHHFTDPLSALQNLHDVLRPGGQFLLAEFEPPYGERLDDCPRYSQRKITWLLREAGFSIQCTETRWPGVLLIHAERPGERARNWRNSEIPAIDKDRSGFTPVIPPAGRFSAEKASTDKGSAGSKRRRRE